MTDLIELVFALLTGEMPWQILALSGLLVAGYYMANFLVTAEPELRRALTAGLFAMAGAGLGALSVWLFPGQYLHAAWLRWLNLLIGPIAGGLFMVGLDHILRSRLPGAAGAAPDQSAAPPRAAKGKGKVRAKSQAPARKLPPPGDRELFARGFLFCLAVAAIRFVFGE